ncbi:MAG: hypothetical protein V4560_03245 [Bacteroidota bacterium]
MRTEKIRGHKRRQRDIEKWRLENLEIRWDLIERYNYHNTKIIIHPWCDLSIIDSKIPEPKGKTKQLILSGLIDIYNSWKEQLNKLDQPFYLKIWLYEPNFSKSQVVCGVGERIARYENIFFKPVQSKQLQASYQLDIREKLNQLTWVYSFDEYNFDTDDINESGEDKAWFEKVLKKPHRITNIDDSIDLFSIKRGDLWIGGES